MTDSQNVRTRSDGEWIWPASFCRWGLPAPGGTVPWNCDFNSRQGNFESLSTQLQQAGDARDQLSGLDRFR